MARHRQEQICGGMETHGIAMEKHAMEKQGAAKALHRHDTRRHCVDQTGNGMEQNAKTGEASDVPRKEMHRRGAAQDRTDTKSSGMDANAKNGQGMELRPNESEATERIRNAQKRLGNAETSTERLCGGKAVF